jgi:hypothetical protein
VFEAEWQNGEQVWRLPAAGGVPVLDTPADRTNDNSPVVLPDGRVASLFVEGNAHQLQLADADGRNPVLLVPRPTDVSDIGMWAAQWP